jgi:predicted metal-dependent hydrolase
MKKIDYTLIRSHRRTLCLEIRDGALVVRSPYLVGGRVIEKFICEKQNWIVRKVTQSKRKIAKPKYIPGEKHLFLGKKRDLGIYRREELKKFYKDQTAKIIEDIMFKRDRAYLANNGKIKIKFYRSKWGSCSAKNSLSFNAVLAMAPIEVIEYVVLHELVHTKIKNHSKKFWSEVEKYDFKYKINRKWLRDNKHILSI